MPAQGHLGPPQGVGGLNQVTSVLSKVTWWLVKASMSSHRATSWLLRAFTRLLGVFDLGLYKICESLFKVFWGLH